MRAIVFGNGTVGKAVQAALREAGHDVVPVGRESGAHRADMTDKGGLDRFFAGIGAFDAVACAAGDVFPAPFAQASDADWARSIASKGMGQINIVRAALPYVSDNGSFTLVSGILTDEIIGACTIGTTINHMVEGFVKGAASELPRGIRINCVSPTVLAESTAYHAFFPGYPPVPAAQVGQAYLRAIANPMTGRVLKLYNLG